MPNWLELLALAVSPGIALALYIFWADKHEKEPIRLLIGCFVLGALSAAPTLAIDFALIKFFGNGDASMLGAAYRAFIIAALVEEGNKFLMLRFYAYPKRDFNEPADGIVYSVMVSLGFATLENVLYVVGAEPGSGLQIGILRMFTAVPGHAAFGVLMGFFVGLAKFRKHHEGRLMFMGLLAAILLHGFYDWFLMQQDYPALALGAFVSLVVGVYLSRRAIRLHVDASPHRLS